MWPSLRKTTLLAASLLIIQQSSALEAPRAPQDVEIEVTKHTECRSKTQDGDTISVHYNGTLTDGKLFDSSHNRRQPITFTLGYGQVIKGWELGLLDMCIGEERTLTIPASLAYGNRGVGMIPPGSTLIFETQLVAISREGTDPDDFAIQTVAAEPEPEAITSSVSSSTTQVATTTYSQTTPTTTDAVAAESQQPISPPPNENRPGSANGECSLLGPFAIFVQGALGLLAVSSLVFKRWRERPRRPFLIWFFDASKQVMGSALLHVLNLLMSLFATADADIVHKAQEFVAQLQNEKNNSVNPCSWYLINIAIDTTIGIPILVVVLRLLHAGAALTLLARPPESIKSGNYGQPPRATWWLKQLLIYFIGLLLMKLLIFFILQLLPWIALVGDWALRWTENDEVLQITFVMFVFPVIMNAIQYYIIDSFIKDSSHGHTAHDETSSQPSYHSVESRDSEDSERDETERMLDEDGKEVDVRERSGRGENSNGRSGHYNDLDEDDAEGGVARRKDV